MSKVSKVFKVSEVSEVSKPLGVEQKWSPGPTPTTVLVLSEIVLSTPARVHGVDQRRALWRWHEGKMLVSREDETKRKKKGQANQVYGAESLRFGKDRVDVGTKAW